eukprot:6189619-Ditylum_brightwellii.AAC.1
MTFLQVALQDILECLHPVKDLGLVVTITNAFAHVIDGNFIPVGAKVDVVQIHTPGALLYTAKPG